jgi:hypothetical protein
MKVQGTGLAILALCDGQRTFTDIVEELQRQYFGADPKRIREDGPIPGTTTRKTHCGLLMPSIRSLLCRDYASMSVALRVLFNPLGWRQQLLN